MGIVGAIVWFVGARQILGRHEMTLGDLMTFTAFLAFLIAPVMQVVSIGTQLTEAFAGLERTHEVLRERPEDRGSRSARSALGTIRGEVDFENVGFSYDTGKPVLFDVSFRAEPGTVTALVGPSGSGKSTIISLIAAFHTPEPGTRHGGRRGSVHGAPGFLPHAVGRGAAGYVPVRRDDRGERRVRAARRRPRNRSWRPAASRAWTSSPRTSRRSTTPSWASAA